MSLDKTIKEHLKEGKEKEQSFQELLESLGMNVEKSSYWEDRNEHWDLKFIGPDGKEFKVDVKGLKKNKRSDSKVDDTIHWIEIQAVSSNPDKLRKGWLYGKADYFAFEQLDSWIMVKKHNLQLLTYEKCIKHGKVARGNWDALYKKYTRVDKEGVSRNDIMTKVKTEDLLQYSTRVIKKRSETPRGKNDMQVNGLKD